MFEKRLATYSARILKITTAIQNTWCRDTALMAQLEILRDARMHAEADAQEFILSELIKCAFQNAINALASHKGIVADVVSVSLPLFADAKHMSLFGSTDKKLLLPHVVNVLNTYAPVRCFSCVLAPLLALERSANPAWAKCQNNARDVALATDTIKKHAERTAPELEGPPTIRPKDVVRFCENKLLKTLSSKP